MLSGHSRKGPQQAIAGMGHGIKGSHRPSRQRLECPFRNGRHAMEIQRWDREHVVRASSSRIPKSVQEEAGQEGRKKPFPSTW